MIYAARDDILPLTHTAVTILLDPSPTKGMAVWYTAAAKLNCSNPDMAGWGQLLEMDLTQFPWTADLFDDPNFWLLLQAVHGQPKCRTTAGVLADFVQERAFDRLGAMLRGDPPAALQVLPGKRAAAAGFSSDSAA